MNLFEATAAEEVLSRLDGITADTPAQWGRMNAAQMMAHCQGNFQTFFRELPPKRGVMSFLFGKMAKKKLFTDKPWPKNLPTAPQFKIADEREFQKEKEKLVDYINRFANDGYTIITSVHPFFGKMLSQEWAVLGYKHLDHHLKQFGV